MSGLGFWTNFEANKIWYEQKENGLGIELLTVLLLQNMWSSKLLLKGVSLNEKDAKEEDCFFLLDIRASTK